MFYILYQRQWFTCIMMINNYEQNCEAKKHDFSNASSLTLVIVVSSIRKIPNVCPSCNKAVSWIIEWLHLSVSIFVFYCVHLAFLPEAIIPWSNLSPHLVSTGRCPGGNLLHYHPLGPVSLIWLTLPSRQNQIKKQCSCTDLVGCFARLLYFTTIV